MKNLILVGVSLFFNVVLFAQEFYLLDGNDQIFSYNYSDGSTNLLATLSIADGTLTDIAYADADHFYGIISDGRIVDIDISTTEVVVIYDLLDGNSYASLVYNSDNNLVLIDQEAGSIITFSLDTNTVISEVVTETSTTGDLTYYQGNLLFQSISNLDVLAYDETDLKAVGCVDQKWFWGLSNYMTNCTTNLVLAFDSSGRVYEFDGETQLIEQVDDLTTEIGSVYGATTINEQFAYDCSLAPLEEVYCEFLRDDHFFLCEYDTSTQTNSIKVIDGSFNMSHLFEVDLPGSILWDIAFSSSGDLYGITDAQQIWRIEGDGSTEFIAQLENISGYASLVGNTSDELILIGSTEAKVLTFSLTTNTIISEVEIPEGSPGDGTYYRGNLIYQGIEVYDMYAYDGTEAETVSCNNELPFRGLANLFEGCLQNDVMAFKENGRFFRFNVQGNGIVFAVDRSSLVDVVYGAATRTEYLASDCTLASLDVLDCGPAPVVGEFFVCDYNPSTGISAIKKVDTNLNVTPVLELEMAGDYLLDIAFSSAGLLYGITANEQIVQILPDGTFTIIAELDGTGNYASMIGNDNNELILVGEDDEMILTFSLSTNAVVSQVEITEGTFGDVTYYNGNLVYPGTRSDDLWGFDGGNELSIICNDLGPIVGLSQIFVDCELSLMWAFSEVGRIYEYDSVENSFSTIANLTAHFDVVYGSASLSEYLAVTCDSVALEDAECLLSTPSEALESLVLYPNPVTTKLWIKWDQSLEGMHYEIFSVQGKKVRAGNYKNGIDFSEFASGPYFVKLQNENSPAFVFRPIIKK